MAKADDMTLGGLPRRGVLGLSMVAAGLAVAPRVGRAAPSPPRPELTAYSSLLKTWCDGLLDNQVQGLRGAGASGGFLCPGCGLVHGRSADAVYPLLRVARTTGDARYVRAAVAVQEWSERHVSRADGSWVNDAVFSDWKGITVFRAIALAEALLHHGDLLDTATREAWRTRLAAAYGFLEGYITIDTGNINYPVSAAYAFSLGAEVLGRPDYEDRAKALAHACLDYFTPNGLLFGEGHPQRSVTPKGRRPVDLGYNIEESLPALAMYGLRARDEVVLDQVTASLRAHMEFMLPDGAWDNSWGSRNYKWTWWGSRTSDGCHPAYRLLADRDPRFAEVSARNLALMQACTHEGLLYGGPHYRQRGYLPCIHHAFAHAKALATVVDLAGSNPVTRAALPRDAAYGFKSFPEIGTHLAAVGPWRATFTDNDFDYLAPGGGGHASGGTLSLLHHQTLGPILAASMTRYKVVETGNQQTPIDDLHRPLTLRIELVDGDTFTSLSDLAAVMTVDRDGDGVKVSAQGRLLTPDGKGPRSDARYTLTYRLDETSLVLTARVSNVAPGQLARLILPIVSSASETAQRSNARMVTIAKPRGVVTVASLATDFEPLGPARIFNLVPGFEALELALPLAPDGVAELRLTAQT
ncbi:hypothetical protein [Caulobacter soli]|uniref:hypothetical protein n=1 Tax=Caulobacter soli TaxID=2708539 RepID=UPI0013EC14E2|nr:hypothetical protein [Caulobacter soli]